MISPFFNISIKSKVTLLYSGYLDITFNKFSIYSGGIESKSYSPTITACCIKVSIASDKSFGVPGLTLIFLKCFNAKKAYF